LSARIAPPKAETLCARRVTINKMTTSFAGSGRSAPLAAARAKGVGMFGSKFRQRLAVK